MEPPVLSLMISLPLIGAMVLLALLRGDDASSNRNAKWATLFVTIVTLLCSIEMATRFDSQSSNFQFVEDSEWFGVVRYRLGLDGIAISFVLLTTLVMPLVIASSWSVEYRVKEYMVSFLVLESLMIGVFCSLDMVLFYFFFEAGLIPMFLIIGVWGGKDRVYASFKFFLYTLLGSLLMLIAMVVMFREAGTTDITVLLSHKFSSESFDLFGWQIAGGLQTVLWFAFFASFAVKMPMWPVHTWLPDAHVQAPTAGSVVLAAILLKMGGYGFLRFSLPMFPVASDLMQNFVFLLSVVAIIYTSLVALVQEDMKKLIAYSSVAHMGFVTLGIFSANRQGLDGAIFQMVSHGFISAALFLCVGVVYDRMHTREISAYGGLVNRMPAYALVFMFFTLGNLGLPGTSGFVGEFLALVGTFMVSGWAALGAATGMVLSAAYSLWLYRRVMLGKLVKPALAGISDLTWQERAIFAPLIAGTLVLGLYPSLVTDLTGASVAALLVSHDAALAESAQQLANR